MANLYDFTERLKLLLYLNHRKSSVNTRHFDDNFQAVDDFARETDQKFIDQDSARSQLQADLLEIIRTNKTAFDNHVEDQVIHIKAAERESWNGAVNAKHTHSNKAVIDKITQAMLDTWDTVSGKAAAVHKHVKADITDFPTSLKNPTALTLKLNGTAAATYDGSAAKEVNVTPADIGAAAASHSHSTYLPLAGGTMTGNLTLKGASTADLMAATKKYVDDLAASAGKGDMLKSVYDTNGDGIVDNAAKVNGLTVQTAVPANAKFTDTTYSLATASANGLMPATDKAKLDKVRLDNVIRKVTIATSVFVANADENKDQYPYCADYTVSGMTATCWANVNLSATSKALGVIEQGNTMAGKLRLYANAVPSADIVIDNIVWKEVG